MSPLSTVKVVHSKQRPTWLHPTICAQFMFGNGPVSRFYGVYVHKICADEHDKVPSLIVSYLLVAASHNKIVQCIGIANRRSGIPSSCPRTPTPNNPSMCYGREIPRQKLDTSSPPQEKHARCLKRTLPEPGPLLVAFIGRPCSVPTRLVAAPCTPITLSSISWRTTVTARD